LKVLYDSNLLIKYFTIDKKAGTIAEKAFGCEREG